MSLMRLAAGGGGQWFGRHWGRGVDGDDDGGQRRWRRKVEVVGPAWADIADAELQ